MTGSPSAVFRPDIEGLRALAVLLVLVYHAGLGFSGGYVGVDVFLVLSGFLITGVLLREAESGRVSLREFWARRARRLLAASSLVVLVTLLVGWLVLEPQRLRSLPGDVFAAATFSSNFRFAAGGDYLAGVALPSPLLHFWSLALEEQFYVIWPLLVVVALRFRSFRRALGVMVAALFAVSFGLSVALTASNPTSSYFLLPTRAWELLAGAGLALLLSSRTRPLLPRWPGLRSTVGVVGFALVVGAGWFFDSSTVFPGAAALVPVAGAVLLVVAGSGGDHAVGKVFSSRVLRWVGGRSYALYLWHWPLLVLAEARFGVLTLAQTSAVLVVSFFAAEVTFRLVENPVRFAPALALPRRSLLLGAGCSIVLLFAATGASLAAPDRGVGALAVVPVSAPVSTSASAPSTTPPVVTAGSPASAPASSASVPPLTDAPVVLPADAGSVLGRVLMVGDSTLAPLRWFEDGARGLSGFEFRLDAESCRRLERPSCKGREGRRPAPVVEVLDELSASGERFSTVVVMGGYHSSPSEFLDEFRAVVDAVRRHGAQLVFVDYRESLEFPEAGSGGARSMYTTFNELMRAEVSSGAYPDVTLLPWHAFSAARPEWFRSDGIHVDLTGALALGGFLSDSLAALAGAPCSRGSAGEVCVVPEFAEPSDLLGTYQVTNTDWHCYEMGSSRARECRPDKLA